jgi:transcriptional antiterminator NusG
MAMHWYVVHTYSGYEQKARKSLEERVRQHSVGHLFEQILVPQESVVEVKKGVKKTTKRHFFPGYILVRMELNETTWHIVKGTPKVTGFVGGSMNPPVVPDEEVARITSRIEEGTMQPTPKIEFDKGDSVRVTSGPFATFAGIVDEVHEGRGKLRVLVSIFGRSTPIELDFTQVEKAT